MNKRKLGSQYEEKAASYLISHGLKILEKNFRSSYAEIDIVAEDGDYLVFVEVKYRRGLAFGTAAEAVDYHKITRIQAASRFYIIQKKISEMRKIRYDVVAIDGENIDWIKDAF